MYAIIRERVFATRLAAPLSTRSRLNGISFRNGILLERRKEKNPEEHRYSREERVSVSISIEKESYALHLTEMNEVRHVLTALMSPAKSATLSNGAAAAGVATATWYDVPAPVIVHCREFQEEADVVGSDNGTKKKNRKSHEMEAEVKFSEISTNVKPVDKEAEAGSLARDSRIISSEKDTMSIARVSVNSEALYQNNVEVDLNNLGKDSSEPQTRASESRANDGNRQGKRHSTTVELNATTTVMTDADGVPTISFSFLRADEQFHENADEDEIVILEVDTSDQVDSGNQLYDLPKSAILGNSQVSLERIDDKEANAESPSPEICQELYDVPKSTRNTSLKGSTREDEAPTSELEPENKKITGATGERNQRCDNQIKRSTRSLKSGRRSYGASDSDGYDAGIASMSGSYSDPECPHEETSTSGGSGRSKRLKLQKRRLGKAWGRMRTWLREEKTRIGEVVNRHARLQAVGALSSEVASENKKNDKINRQRPNKR